MKLKDVRKIVEHSFKCIFSDDCEADDLISEYQYRGRLDKSYIACTVDKDAKQTPGWLFNPLKETIKECSGFGNIELITKTSAKGIRRYSLDGKGRSFFYYQLICGDPVDTYCAFPTPLTPLKFFNEFGEIKNDKDAWSYVISKYKEAFSDLTEYVDFQGDVHKGSWLDILQNYVDVVHMRRFTNDRVIVKDVLKKMELL